MDENEDAGTAGNVTRGVPIATPSSTARKEADVNDALTRAGFDTSGQSDLVIHGRNGREIPRGSVTVGGKYLLKLHHLVDDKIHARFDRARTASSPSSPGRQGAVRRPALRRDGGLALEAYGATYTCRRC